MTRGKVRAQIIVGLGLLALMVYLWSMSDRTGQAAFDEGKRRLDTVEMLNMRLDGLMFPLLFELQIDFDGLTEAQQELAAAARRLGEALPTAEAARLTELLEQKLTYVEDYKSLQAVQRNSRTIARQTIEALWQTPAVQSRGASEDLFGVERAYLDYNARRDPASAETLRETVRELSADGEALAAEPLWPVLEAHVLNLLSATEAMGELMLQTYTLPIPQTLLAAGARLQNELAASAASAARYRGALFAVAVLLLGFSAFKVAQIGRYLQLLRDAKGELEDRVARRTEQLTQANRALREEIAERKTVESQLRIAQKLESIGQLAAGIAHEINTPTQYVSDNVSFLEDVWRDTQPLLAAYSDAMEGKDLDETRARALWQGADMDYVREEVPAALEQARGGLRQIADIVAAIKKFSHPGGEESQVADINAAIRNTVLVARNEWKYVAEVTMDLDHSLPAVPCDLSAFNQVMLNLIVNAAQAIGSERAAGEKGSIRICTRRAAENVEILVEDDGPGIDVALRERVFDPFFTTKPVGQGTGQGLAIAHRIITRHGGTLTTEQASGGRGALFRIRLPAEPDELGVAERSTSQAATA